MPRGSHPNSRANLKQFTPKEAREQGKKGAVASAKARRELRDMKEILKESTSDEELKDLGEALKRRAKHSDNSLELMLKILGMMPKAQVEVSTPIDDSIREMSAYFGQDENTGIDKK